MDNNPKPQPDHRDSDPEPIRYYDNCRGPGNRCPGHDPHPGHE